MRALLASSRMVRWATSGLDVVVVAVGVCALSACNCGARTVQARGQIEVSPSVLDFGGVEKGRDVSQVLTISAVGRVAVEISSIEVVDDASGSFFVTAESGRTVPSVVLRQEPEPEPTPIAPAATEGQRAPKRRPKLDWATIQARTFGEDVWKCGRCGGRRRIVAVVTSHRTAEEVLRNLGLLPKRQLLPPEHGPPQLELAM